VLTLVLAVAGPIACVRLVRAGSRAAAADRVRDLGSRSRWRIPARWRGPLARALHDADVPWTPEQAVEHWAIGVAAVERLAHGGGVVGRDLHRVHVRTRLGLPLEDALAGWPQEHDAPGVRAAAGALSVAAAMGGKAGDAIDGLARSLRSRLDAMAEARALSAQARLSALVVGAAPLGYLAFSALVDPAAVTALVDTGVGRVCLVLGLGLEALAGLWIRRILGSAG
jgi:tight adherence protein B